MEETARETRSNKVRREYPIRLPFFSFFDLISYPIPKSTTVLTEKIGPLWARRKMPKRKIVGRIFFLKVTQFLIFFPPRHPKISAMESYVVEQSLIDLMEWESIANEDEQHQHLSTEQVKTLTMWVVVHSLSREDAARRWNKEHPEALTSKSSVDRYVSFFKKTGKYMECRHSGRVETLSPGERERLLKLFAGVRAKGKPVDSRLFACMARGVIESCRPGSTVLSGGPIKCSLSWAQSTMHKLGIQYRGATTDRVMTPHEIVAFARNFAEDIFAVKNETGVPDPRLTFNMDEFFLLLEHSGGKRTMTWHFSRATIVAVKDNKLGTTFSITSAADGSMPLPDASKGGALSRWRYVEKLSFENAADCLGETLRG